MSDSQLSSAMRGGSCSTLVALRFLSINWLALYSCYVWSFSQVNPTQTHFHECAAKFPEIGCSMFTDEMSRRATTMSLSILVTIEMFNAMNSLSENESLLKLPLWKNMYLVSAIALSMGLHVMILYVPFFTVSVQKE